MIALLLTLIASLLSLLWTVVQWCFTVALIAIGILAAWELIRYALTYSNL